MSSDKLVPNDPRVKYESTKVRGKTYSFILGEPSGTPRGTAFLIHGFPDMSFGWRCQIPFFMSRGYRVVAPDMLGYSGTDSPTEIAEFTLKNVSADMNELARKFVGSDRQIILGGHDWGGALVWRIALWYPELIRAIFSVCTPFHHPSKVYAPLEDMIAAGKFHNFKYQIQFKGREVEAHCQGAEKMRQFLNSMYGAKGSNGEVAVTRSEGIIFDNLPKVGTARLLSPEELDHYVERYMLQQAPQLRGPLNWYRTRRFNWEDESPLAEQGVHLKMPALFIAASGDTYLPPAMSAGMDAHFEDLTRGEVDASHWALTQAPDEVNRIIGTWLDGVEGSARSSL